MALKLIVEPVFEVRPPPVQLRISARAPGPGGRAQDAIAEIHHFSPQDVKLRMGHRGDIKACFDNLDHHVLVSLVGERCQMTAR